VLNRAPKQGKLNILHATHLSKLTWLIHGFSTRLGGSSRAYGEGELNLGFTKDDSKAAVERNRASFLLGLGAVSKRRKALRGVNSRPWPLVTLRQIHSDIIHFVDSPAESQLVGDGLITAAELHAHGSVYQVVPRAELDDAALAVARDIAAKDPRVIRAAKEALNGIDPQQVHRSYRYEQGFTFELNLLGAAGRARQAFLAEKDTEEKETDG